MTKEEAIKYLKQLYPNGGHCWLDEQRIEAISMAVNALQEEPAPKIFEDMLNAKTPAESLGISEEEHEKIIDLCLYGKEPEMVDIDDLPKEEPVSIWHDSNKEQPNFASTVAIWNPKYKNGEIISRCTEVYSDRIWAYIDDLLKM